MVHRPKTAKTNRACVWMGFWLCLVLQGGLDENQSRFTTLALQDGLSQNAVYCVLQDRFGYLWLGTENGLNRYDGFNFQVYQHDPFDLTSISDDDVSCLVEDEAGTLWVGTWGGGLNRFERSSGAFVHVPLLDEEQRAGLRIHQMYPDGLGSLYIATRERGLFRLELATGTVVHHGDAAGRIERVWSIAAAADNLLWVGTGRGLYLFDPLTEAFRPYARQAEVPIDLGSAEIRVLTRTVDGTLWVGTDRGLVQLADDPAQTRYFVFGSGPGQLQGRAVNTIYQSRDRELWIGTFQGGAARYLPDEQSFRVYQPIPDNPYSLPNNDVRAIVEDRGGILWLGTRGGGLAKFDRKPAKFQLYRHQNESGQGLSHEIVRAIATAADGRVWVGTLGGLDLLDRQQSRVTHFQHDPNDPASLPSDTVFALHADNDGGLWVGTLNGLSHKPSVSSGFRTYRHDPQQPDSLPNDSVLSLLQQAENILWVGTRGGLARFNGETFVTYRHDAKLVDSISDDRIFCLLESQRGDVWIGTAAGGLNRYVGDGRFVNYRHHPGNAASLSNDSVLSIYEGTRGLWLGTHGGGLNYFDPDGGHFRRFVQKNGLPNNVVYGIEGDDNGFLWMSTNRGLSRFDPNAETFRNFDVKDGLQSNQFSIGAAFKSNAGELFFGGVRGLNVIQPDAVRFNPHVPPVVINDVEVVDHGQMLPVYDRKRISLGPDENTLSFSFAALDYTVPTKNRYRYQLDGADEVWHNAGNRRFTTYAQIPPGRYTFRVQGSNNDGVWNKAGAALDIVVAPPFYRSKMALIIYGLMVCLLLLVLFQIGRQMMRKRREIRRLEESERIAVEGNRAKSAFLARMSHELRTPLNAIIGYSEMMDEELVEESNQQLDPQSLSEDLQRIKASALYQLTLVDNILDLSKIEAGAMRLFLERFSVPDLVDAVLSNIRPQVAKNQNRLTVDMDGKVNTMLADRTKVQQILLNLLSNANKFTDGGDLELRVRREHRQGEVWLTFRITDTGIGMTVDQQAGLFKAFGQVNEQKASQGTGLGLTITKHFTESMGGRIDVASTFGQGSTFTVWLPERVKANTGVISLV